MAVTSTPPHAITRGYHLATPARAGDTTQMLTGAAGRARECGAACALNWRSPNLRRAQAAFGVIWASEWAATVAVAVIAFRHGGVAAVGLVGVARMVPAALVAPFAAVTADRAPRHRVLAWVGVGRAACLAAACAVAAAGGPVVLVYAALVAATTAQTLFRPAHSALLPSLCATPTELTSANAARGLLDSGATLVGPLIAAVLLKTSGPAAVLGVAAGASLLAGALAASLRYELPPRLNVPSAQTSTRRALEGLRAIAADRALTLLTALTTLQTFTRGALTVFSVSLSITLLHSGQAGVGVLTAAVGAGAIAGSLGAVLLIGRGGLARWFGAGVALWGAPLAAIAALAHLWSAIAFLALVGVGNALLDVGVFTLIARLADDTILARVFGAFEGIITLGVAAGGLAAAALIGAFGLRAALVVVGLIPPVAVLGSWRALGALDRRIKVRDHDVALLNDLPMLRPLPESTIEQLASRLTREELPAGACVFRQDDDGDDFFVIEAGCARVIKDGRQVNELGPGQCFGEIALLRNCARTASVHATTALTLRRLTRTAFVSAVARYSLSSDAADQVIADHLSDASTMLVR
jgi:MFS family permease